jgi:hypothetical protein
MEVLGLAALLPAGVAPAAFPITRPEQLADGWRISAGQLIRETEPH